MLCGMVFLRRLDLLIVQIPTLIMGRFVERIFYMIKKKEAQTRHFNRIQWDGANVQGAKKSKSMFKAGKELKVTEDGELHFLSFFLIRFCSAQLPRLAVPVCIHLRATIIIFL